MKTYYILYVMLFLCVTPLYVHAMHKQPHNQIPVIGGVPITQKIMVFHLKKLVQKEAQKQKPKSSLLLQPFSKIASYEPIPKLKFC